MLNELFITQSNFIKMDSPCVIFEFKCMKFIQSAIPNDFELAEHIKVNVNLVEITDINKIG